MKEKIKSYLENEDKKLKKIDYIVLAIIILLYSILSFYNLGSTKNPQTFFKTTKNEHEVLLDIGSDPIEISFIRSYAGNILSDFNIYYSEDGENYEYFEELKHDQVFAWKDTFIQKKLRYLKLEAVSDEVVIGEIQLYDLYGYPLNSIAGNDESEKVVDELNKFPTEVSYFNSTYFDEIYFARTAYEYANGLTAYEWVHPPLGKIIQMLPIKLFGMTPFNYRLMGNIAGIAMIFVMYLLGKEIFKKRKWALIAALLMTFDNFHFAQTRMGTIDTFLVLFIMISFLFMFKYLKTTKDEKLYKRITLLFGSGLFIGLAIATKWTGLFAGLGLFVLYLIHFIKNNLTKKNRWTMDTTKIVIASCLFFVYLPLLIYAGIYFAFPDVTPNYITDLDVLVLQQHDMYDYHSQLTETHPFTSAWYSWPLMIKPVWYSLNYYTETTKSTISGIGNPLIWWVGAVAMLYTLVTLFKKDNRYEKLLILIPIIAMWLPYLFIGRVMFMYHFFPVLPFMMLAIIAMFKDLTKKHKTNRLIMLYLIVVMITFGVYYPVTSGMKIPENYANAIKLLPGWQF